MKLYQDKKLDIHVGDRVKCKPTKEGMVAAIYENEPWTIVLEEGKIWNVFKDDITDVWVPKKLCFEVFDEKNIPLVSVSMVYEYIEKERFDVLSKLIERLYQMIQLETESKTPVGQLRITSKIEEGFWQKVDNNENPPEKH